MLHWLTARRSPVEDHEQLWVDEHLDILVQWLTPERIRRTTVIEPSDHFFPGSYDNSVASVQQHIEQLIGHIGRNLEPFEETGIAFQLEALRIDTSLVRQPLVLSASIGLQLAAQALQTGFLNTVICRDWMQPQLSKPEAVPDIEDTLTTAVYASHPDGISRENTLADSAGKLTERLIPMAGLLTVLFGTGLFSANTAIPDSGCGCSSTGCGTAGARSEAGLSGPQFAWALARFAAIQNDSSPDWVQHLRLDVRSPFRQAHRFLQHRAA